MLVLPNPNLSNRRSAVQWYFPLRSKWVFSALTVVLTDSSHIDSWPLCHLICWILKNLFRKINLTLTKSKICFIRPLCNLGSHTLFWPVWPDRAIYLTLGNFVKPLATINLPKSPTFLGNFCKGVKIYHFSSEIIFR